MRRIRRSLVRRVWQPRARPGIPAGPRRRVEPPTGAIPRFRRQPGFLNRAADIGGIAAATRSAEA